MRNSIFKTETFFMKSFCLLFCTYFCTAASFAQLGVKKDLGFVTKFSEPSQVWRSASKSYEDMNLKEGSPFFQETWAKGKIVTPDKKVVSEIDLKIDLLADRVICRDSAGREWVIDEPLNEILLDPTTNTKSLHFLHGNLLPVQKVGWYEVLLNDTVSLIKGWKKSLDTRVSYTNGPEQSVSSQELYWVYFFYQEFQVTKPTDFVRIIPSMKTQIEQYASSLKGKLTTEDKLTKMAVFCNTLKGLHRF